MNLGCCSPAALAWIIQMPFPFSYTNKIEVPFDANKHTPDNLLSSIVSSLKNVKARNIQNDRNRITFSGGILRLVMNWNILVTVSSGEITVEKDNDKIILNYHIKFTEMFVIATAMVLGFMGPFLFQAPRWYNQTPEQITRILIPGLAHGTQNAQLQASWQN